jgi:hypothetical protein
MTDFKDLPIRFDRPALCERCNGITQHTVTEYPDEEIRTCTRCRTRTIITFEGKEKTDTTSFTPDHTLEDYNFKRAVNRKYRKSNDKGDRDA